MHLELLTGLALAVVPAAAVPASATAPAASDRPPLRATLAGCHAGPQPSDRVAAFQGSMPAQAGTARMAMRFTLQVRRSGDTDWTEIPGAPGFGTWERSQPARAGFVFLKRIDGLGRGLLYRASVQFRWYAADGSVQRRETRNTRACRQPGVEGVDTLG